MYEVDKMTSTATVRAIPIVVSFALIILWATPELVFYKDCTHAKVELEVCIYI
jgi:hypothetical protein